MTHFSNFVMRLRKFFAALDVRSIARTRLWRPVARIPRIVPYVASSVEELPTTNGGTHCIYAIRRPEAQPSATGCFQALSLIVRISALGRELPMAAET